MKHWSNRVSRPSPGQPPSMPPAVQEVQNAAQQLAQQAHHAPGRLGTSLRMIADTSMIGAAFLTSIVAGVHLYKSLFPRPRDDHREHPGEGREPQPQGSGQDRPPSRRLTMVAGHGRGRSRD